MYIRGVVGSWVVAVGNMAAGSMVAKTGVEGNNCCNSVGSYKSCKDMM